MKKGISFFYGYISDAEIRTKKIKETGFDCVITNQDPRLDDQNGNIEKQMKLFEKYGLKVSSLHNQYKACELENFWLDNEIGDRLERTLKYDILTAQKYGIKCVVAHMIGDYNKIGEDRIKRVLDLCNETGVALAIENINHKNIFFDIFKNIDHPYLKFCYDSGHNNCFDPSFDYLEKYGDKLICLHLHDNMGQNDDHTLNKYGNIDWDKIAQKLAKCDTENLVLDYEIFMIKHKEDVSEDECLQETFKQACELEKMIEKYKKQ